MKRVSFLESLKVFKEREIFRRLCGNSRIRAVWHLLLMSFLASCFIVSMEQYRQRPRWRALERAFCTHFGENVTTTATGGMLPELAPERSRSLMLPMGGALFYVAPGAVPDLSGDFWQKEHYYVILWGPGATAAVTREDEKIMLLSPDPENVMKYTVRTCTPAGLAEQLKKISFGEKTALPEHTLSVPALLGMAQKVIWLSGTIVSVLSLFLLALLYSGIFTLMFCFTGRRRLRVLTLRELWICTVYASFPAMAVASCFPALELPFFRYSTVFMIGQMGYSLAVLVFFERSAAANTQGEE